MWIYILKWWWWTILSGQLLLFYSNAPFQSDKSKCLWLFYYILFFSCYFSLMYIFFAVAFSIETYEWKRSAFQNNETFDFFEWIFLFGNVRDVLVLEKSFRFWEETLFLAVPWFNTFKCLHSIILVLDGVAAT